jgi:2-(3-amino-3-carboxypropyl)histidine synthase
MKKLFITAQAKRKVRLTEHQLSHLPLPIGLVTTVQHEDAVKEFHRSFDNSVYCGPVLGCDVSPALKKTGQVKAYLFIGTGQFHPLMIALKTKKPVFTLNPYGKALSRVSDQEVINLGKRKKGALLKFMSSKRIGILVSTKPGQQRFREALRLKRRLKDKQCYILVADNIDTGSLQDFPFMDCFVNTACPRISDDSTVPMVNLEDI